MNLRKEVRKANLKKWQAQGPAVIQRPLRRIREKCPDICNAEGTFGSFDPTYAFAKRIADRGNGRAVKTVARTVI